jgi:uncharacterized protein with NRDE domain
MRQSLQGRYSDAVGRPPVEQAATITAWVLYNRAMCLIVFAYRYHPRYRLIMTANRDEFYRRPARPVRFWGDDSGILAGQDLEAGGTWLGLRRDGRLAAVTNFREGKREVRPRSRGELTTNFLHSDLSPRQYGQVVKETGDEYSGFSLLVADRHGMVYCSNRSDRVEAITPGIHSLSNHLLDSAWPKSKHAKDELEILIRQDTIRSDDLIACLHRRKPFPDEQLPSTGVDLETERALSPPFIATPDYGTRCTTTVLWSHDGELELTEQNYSPGGKTGQREGFSWKLN